MVNPTSGDYIPYKYVKTPDRDEIRIYTRGVDRDERKVFTHPSNKWIIVDPHRYPDEGTDDRLRMLAAQFQTTSITFDERSDRFIIRDSPITVGYRSFEIDDSDFKSLTVLPDAYATHIIMNGKRFYNSIENNGEWLDDRKAKSHQSHHYFLSEKEFCRAMDPTHPKSPSVFKGVEKDVDIVFTSLTSDRLSEIYGDMPPEIDVVHIPSSPKFVMNSLLEISTWYIENIRQLYSLSFIASRNLSDVWPQNKETSKLIAEDILLGLNLSLYNGLVSERLPPSYGVKGKYTDSYFYQIGPVLKGLLEDSACDKTSYVGKSLTGIEMFNDVIASIYLSSKLEPREFELPESTYYFDRRILCSSVPLHHKDYDVTFEHVDYTIIFGAQSMIKCIKSSNSSHRLNNQVGGNGIDQEDHIIFTGIHHICRPLFPAAYKVVKDYAIGMMYGDLPNWDMLAKIVEKTQSNFEIKLSVNESNIDQYRHLLTPSEIKLVEKKGDKLPISTWLTSMENSEISRVFDAGKNVVPSLNYIKRILSTLDIIPSR